MRLLLSAAILATFSGSIAFASPVEQLTDVGFGPGDPAAIVVSYMNGGGGLIFGDEGARRWRLQCGSAFLTPGAMPVGSLLLLADGTSLLATQREVIVGAPGGCDFRVETPLAGGLVLDWVVDPTEPVAALALVNSSDPSSSRTRLLRRSAAGVWSELGVADDALATSVRAVAHAAGLRIYEAALVATEDEDAGSRYFTYHLRYSDDGALSFTDNILPADAEPRVIGVDPSNADRIVVLIDRSSAADSIMVSRDRGATLTPYLQLGQYGGMTFAPDGRVWIGGSAAAGSTEQGVWAAADLDSPPRRLPQSDYPVQCLQYRAPSDRLYACQHFWLGEVDAGTGAFTTVLSFAEVGEFVQCDGASAARCETQLCGAYCGPGHFAFAPVCAAYDAPTCGGPVAAQESGISPDAGLSSPPSAAGAGSAGTNTPGASGRSAGAASADAGSNRQSRPGAAGASCGVADVRAAERGPWWWTVLLVLAFSRLFERSIRRPRRV